MTKPSPQAVRAARALGATSKRDFFLREHGLANIDKVAAIIDAECGTDEAMRALESLTPGGSEYVGDVPRCVEFIKKARALEHEQLLKQSKARQAAEASTAELVEALRECLAVFAVATTISAKPTIAKAEAALRRATEPQAEKGGE